MSLSLVRLDDRLVHGQVVVGWGQALGANLIVLVDDLVRSSEWEREVYTMGVLPGMDIEFASLDEAIAKVPKWIASDRRVILLAGDVDTMVRLCEARPDIKKVNIGGIHHRPGRVQRKSYVFASDEEVERLRQLTERGVDVYAQDVPTARPVPLPELT